MKIKGAKMVHYDSGPNMTPLVDVVMVILIFLMLAGSFGATSHYLTSNLPVQDAAGPPREPKPGEIPPEIVRVQIIGTRDGFRVVGDNMNSQGTVITRDWLVDRFKDKKQALATQGKTDVDNIQVVLAPTMHTRYDHIALVYEAALSAQFTKVAFQLAR